MKHFSKNLEQKSDALPRASVYPQRKDKAPQILNLWVEMKGMFTIPKDSIPRSTG
jgi:hypothetical protein